MDSILISPYGSELVNLLVTDNERTELEGEARTLPSVRLSPRSVCDLELLATGGFSPLRTFMGTADYRRVVGEMRLADGTLFPIPVTLPIARADAPHVGSVVALRSPKNDLLAVMHVEEVFEYDPVTEARWVTGTTDSRHPLVAEMNLWGPLYVTGPLRVLSLPRHHDFPELRKTPAGVRTALAALGHRNVVAFQTRNPMHRAHEELTRRAAEEIGGTLLVHPVVGLTKPDDIDHFTRVRTYKLLVEKHYDPKRTALALLPLAMRFAGPREAVWHAIIRRNHGANHFIVGRDHASPGRDSRGKDFYRPTEAQDLLGRHEPEIGVTMLPHDDMVYVADRDTYEPIDRVPPGSHVIRISGSVARDDYLAQGRPLPEWHTRSEVARILAEEFPPRSKRGFCVWFTGLPSAGKSTIAEILAVGLRERGRRVTLLDGDVVRTHLSRGLGFSKEDRNANVLRIGFVAAEIVKHHGAVICAAVSPYEATRNLVRDMLGDEEFVLVFVDTPLEICTLRDTKGLYNRARAGTLKGLTGVDDPYEVPQDPDVVLTTMDCSPEDNTSHLIRYLIARGYLTET